MINPQCTVSGVSVFQSNHLEDDQVVICKEPPQVFAGQLAYLQIIWRAGRKIDDYIEWRCAFYSRQIDKKYYL